MVFKLRKITFDFMTPIDEICKRLPNWSLTTITKRRKEALRLAHNWESIDWEKTGIEKLAQDLDLPVQDIRDMKKMIAFEKEKWANVDYNKSDEEIALEKDVQPKRVQYYRQFYDKKFSKYTLYKKENKKGDLISVRVRPDMKKALEYQAEKTGYKLPNFIRLVLLKHLANNPSFPSNVTNSKSTLPDYINNDELQDFQGNLMKLRG